ncbi:DBH-like monooxygenase protein 1, partial [Lingula anatina]|uniref:DBH-like monooxygenase protein 1 n=1 Tax=Lingula anatina TaxID=7574 RepID=A0A2R2MLW8_LINAN
MGATECFRWVLKFICILLATYLNRAATVQDSGDVSLFTLHTALRDGDYYVRWKVNGEYITFETTARTTGYVALGFSTNGGMAGSDIIIGWVNDGEVIIQDYHAIGEEQPLLDESQDVEILGGTDNGTFTTLRFRRKLETCDDNDCTITEGTVRLLWAFRDGDPDPAIGPQYHVTNRGAKSAYLLNPVKKEDVEPLPDDTYAIDIINDKVHIQNKTDTTYWCQGFKLPEFNGIHHLIRIEPIIQPGHEALIHHMNVYGCYHDLNQTDLHLKGGVCNTDNMPDDFKQCKVLIMGWAFGGE